MGQGSPLVAWPGSEANPNISRTGCLGNASDIAEIPGPIIEGEDAGSLNIPLGSWTFWMYSDEEGGELREIDQLRQNYLAQKKPKVVPMS